MVDMVLLWWWWWWWWIWTGKEMKKTDSTLRSFYYREKSMMGCPSCRGGTFCVLFFCDVVTKIVNKQYTSKISHHLDISNSRKFQIEYITTNCSCHCFGVSTVDCSRNVMQMPVGTWTAGQEQLLQRHSQNSPSLDCLGSD